MLQPDYLQLPSYPLEDSINLQAKNQLVYHERRR